MSAVVIDLVSVLAGRKPRPVAVKPQAAARRGALSHDFTFWRGATGARYVHTVYALLECPELPAANVMLVRRMPGGRAEVLHVGRVENEARSLNLAEIRQSAASLGANEVHVHLLAETLAERAAIERDLASASEPTSSTLH